MAETTLFQKILSGEIPGNFVGRGENWAAFLDVFPRAKGHTLVVPVNPVQRIAELSK
jgi:histidine triad (HIT) family protein